MIKILLMDKNHENRKRGKKLLFRLILLPNALTNLWNLLDMILGSNY